MFCVPGLDLAALVNPSNSHFLNLNILNNYTTITQIPITCSLPKLNETYWFLFYKSWLALDTPNLTSQHLKMNATKPFQHLLINESNIKFDERKTHEKRLKYYHMGSVGSKVVYKGQARMRCKVNCCSIFTTGSEKRVNRK